MIMNMRMITVAGLALPLLLTACGDGTAVDEGFKATYRNKLVATCTATAQSYVPSGVVVDIDKICGCGADKIMEGKSAQELATTVPGNAEDVAKVRECITELGPVKIGAAG